MVDKRKLLNWMKTEADLEQTPPSPDKKVTGRSLDWLRSQSGLEVPPGYAFYYGELCATDVEIKWQKGRRKKIAAHPPKKRGRPGIKLTVYAELNWLLAAGVPIPDGNTEAAKLVLAHWPDQD